MCFKRSRVHVRGINDHFDVDLADFQKVAKENNGS